MVAEIKRAFEENLKHVGWMDADTKKAAKEKVSWLSQVAPERLRGRRQRRRRRDAASLLCDRRQTPFTTWWDIQTSSRMPQTSTKCSMM